MDLKINHIMTNGDNKNVFDETVHQPAYYRAKLIVVSR